MTRFLFALLVALPATGEPKLQARLDGHGDGPHVIRFSADGTRIGVGIERARSRVVRISKTHDGKTEREIEIERLRFLGFAPDDGQILAGDRRSIRAWSLADGVEIGQDILRGGALRGPADLPVFARGGKSAVSIDPSGRLGIREWPSGRELANLGEMARRSGAPLNASVVGCLLITSQGDFHADLWNVCDAPGKIGSIPGNPFLLPARLAPEVAASRDGTLLAASSANGLVTVYDSKTARRITILQGGAPVSSAVFTPSGKIAALSTAGRTIRVYDSKAGRLLRTLGPFGRDDAMELSALGTRLCVTGADGVPVLWNVETGARVARLEGHDGRPGVVFSSDGSWVATSGELQEARLWNASTGKVAQIFGVRNTRAVTGIAFSEDSDMAAVSFADGVVEVWTLNPAHNP